MGESGFGPIEAAERELLDGAIRRDPARVSSLLHSDFVEIGRSGRRWSREDLIDALATEQEHVTPATDDWQFAEVAPTLILVTYRISSATGSSRHSSLWDIGGAAPVMRFHQGTVVRTPEQ